MEENSKELKLQIDLDDVTAQGVYCNFVIVNHSDAEFVIDFIYLQPMQPKAKVRSRIITSPRHAKKLIKALSENLRHYEKEFGPLPDEPAERGHPGIVH